MGSFVDKREFADSSAFSHEYVKDTGLTAFLSYSHPDEGLRAEFAPYLGILEREGLITTWQDRMILPGDEWRSNIHSELDFEKTSGSKWNPGVARVFVPELGADIDDTSRFPCCGRKVCSFDAPFQFRADGCETSPLTH